MSKVVRTLLSADKDARLKMLGRSALNLAANTNHVTACGPLPDASEVHQLVLPSVCVCGATRGVWRATVRVLPAPAQCACGQRVLLRRARLLFAIG